MEDKDDAERTEYMHLLDKLLEDMPPRVCILRNCIMRVGGRSRIVSHSILSCIELGQSLLVLCLIRTIDHQTHILRDKWMKGTIGGV